MPENMTWKDAIWTHSHDVKGCWENENVGNILSLIGSCSHSKKYLVSGDDDGIIRLYSYPCTDTKVHTLVLKEIFLFSCSLCCATKRARKRAIS